MKTKLEVGDRVHKIYDSKIDDTFTITRVTKATAFDETHKLCPISFWRTLDQRGRLKRVGFAGRSSYQYYLEDSKLQAKYQLQKRRDIMKRQLHEISGQLPYLTMMHLNKVDMFIDECQRFGLDISD